LIVVSVALGFAVSQLGESRAERRLAARVLKGVGAEVEYNLATVEPYIRVHHQWADALGKEAASTGTASGVEVFLATRPELPPRTKTNIPVLRRAAWDTTLSTEGLRLLDYEVAAGLSEIYGWQGRLEASAERIASETAFFDHGSRDASVKRTWWAMQDVVTAEEALVVLYRQHLSAVRGPGTTP
jgi:hypothetical protein